MGAVRSRAACKIVTLDDAGETLALANAGDLDLLARLENRDGDLRLLLHGLGLFLALFSRLFRFSLVSVSFGLRGLGFLTFGDLGFFCLFRSGVFGLCGSGFIHRSFR